MSRPKYHKWTTAEDQTLRRLAGEGKRSAEIARALGLRTAQVYHYAHDHEISVRTRGYIHTHAADAEPRPWTDSELMMLALLRWRRKSIDYCAGFLGRTRWECKKMLERHPDYFAEREAAI